MPENHVNKITEARRLFEAAKENAQQERLDEACGQYARAWELAEANQLTDLATEIIPKYSRLLYEQNKHDEAIAFHHKAIDHALTHNNSSLLANMYTGLSALLWFTREYDEAYEVGLKARRVSKEINDIPMLVKAVTNLALIQTARNLIPSSLEYYREVFSLQDECEDLRPILNASLNITGLYLSTGDLERAQTYAERGVELARKYNDKKILTALLSNIASIHQERKEYQQALDGNLEVLELLKEFSPLPHWLANAYLNTGLAYNSLDRFNEGEPYLLRAIEISHEHPKACKESMVRAKANLANSLNARQRYEEAEKIFVEILPMLDNLRLGQSRINILVFYSDSLSAMGKHQEANKVLLEAVNRGKSYFDEQIGESIASAKAMLDHESKVREADLLKLKNTELEEALDMLGKAQDTILELERMQTIQAMAVTASHEINQPLMIIRGNLDMLVDSFQNISDPQQRYLSRIDSALQRIDTILNKFKTAQSSQLAEYSTTTQMFTFGEE